MTTNHETARPPTAIVTYKELHAYVRSTWPDKSEAWRDAVIMRMLWYVAHNGDMAGAPELPDE